MREKNLYQDVRRLDRIAAVDESSFDNGGARIILEAGEIDAFARADPSTYRPSTAFFRSYARDPLPADIRRDLRKGIMKLVSSDRAKHVIGDPAFATGAFMTQGWGVNAVLEILFPIICGGRDARLQALTREYVERVVVGSSVRGFRRKRRTQVSTQIWAEMEPLMADLEGDNQTDLVGVALNMRERLSRQELPEVYSRLVLSMVGFTGISLEWALVLGCRKTGGGQTFLHEHPVRAVLDESLRLAPTAWKMIREQPVDATETQFRKVVMMTSVVHRSSKHWTDPYSFRPDRWTAPSAAASMTFFPFGKGSMACPARQFAIDLLCSALERLRSDYSIEFGPCWSGPRAHILLVPPRQRLQISVATADHGGR